MLYVVYVSTSKMSAFRVLDEFLKEIHLFGAYSQIRPIPTQIGKHCEPKAESRHCTAEGLCPYLYAWLVYWYRDIRPLHAGYWKSRRLPPDILLTC
jgi:hypothetical protein